MYDLFDRFTKILPKGLNVLSAIAWSLVVLFVVTAILVDIFRMYVYWRGVTPTGAVSVLYEYDSAVSKDCTDPCVSVLKETPHAYVNVATINTLKQLKCGQDEYRVSVGGTSKHIPDVYNVEYVATNNAPINSMTRDLATIRVTKVSLVEVQVNGLLRWTLKNLVIEYEITNADDLKRIIQTEKQTNERLHQLLTPTKEENNERN
jgi:hypothetical protein